MLLVVFLGAEEAAVKRRKGGRQRRRRNCGRTAQDEMAAEEGVGRGLLSGGKAEREDDVVGRLRAGCGSERLAAGRRRKTKHDATINLHMKIVQRQRVLVCMIEHLADNGERRPGCQRHG